MSKKNSGDISDDDITLFRDAMKGVTQMQPPDKVVHQRPAIPAHRQSREITDDMSFADMMSDEMAIDQVETGDVLNFSRDGIQHSVMKKLRKGHYPVEAELDLHGMRSDEARQSIVRPVSYKHL
ncbi:MAG: DNA mismatch repair protein MutS, partial [Gammaproteobacteria bacterium]|nr:DNA mismatch repair protein MutS [Gammaproteobacteria bacterium]